MADKNIDYAIRKPRRTKGTPFHTQRNYYALGVVGLSGLAWLAYEYWPQTNKLRTSVKEGKFKYPPAVQDHILLTQRTTSDPALTSVIAKLREKIKDEEEKSKPQPWFSKLLNSQPEL